MDSQDDRKGGTQEKTLPFRVPEPAAMVIFGASGDLTHRKLMPALYNLHCKHRLPEGFTVVGYSRTPFTHEAFRKEMRAACKEYGEVEPEIADWKGFAQRLFYCPGDINKPADFEHLHDFLHRLEVERVGAGNRVYYLAVAPQFYDQVVERICDFSMADQEGAYRRIVVEKPFGRDLDSARQLNQRLHKVFREDQIYRIDHYLGKETAQNILFLRFANTIYEPVWNRNYVDHVQISVAETLTVGHRAGFYEQAGVLRDVFQNHLLQLLALMTMEPPASFNADMLRNETMKVLSSIHPIAPEAAGEHTLRAQYRGYREEKGVAPDSQVATYAVVRLFIDNWRWQGVPFYLRSGKAMAEKCSEIIIQFKSPPHVLFPLAPGQEIDPNLLVLRIQPDEGIHVRFEAKVPDTAAEMRPVDMNFDYASAFGGSAIPDAYERLLLDLLHGDASLFARKDGIEAAWALIDSILAGWEGPHAPPLYFYDKGSWGPPEADALLSREAREWLEGCRD
ncbi:MAG TPA: glucose-6-phosphate dehydrogenase [Anaerolineales bacterium]